MRMRSVQLEHGVLRSALPGTFEAEPRGEGARPERLPGADPWGLPGWLPERWPGCRACGRQRGRADQRG